MNTEETKIIEFLTAHPHLFVSVTELSKFLDRNKFEADRFWAGTLLRRMEMAGSLEVNRFGEYRVKKRESDTKLFRQALGQPGIKLGDTTIVLLEDANASLPKPAQAAGF